ncbi:MAG TPA: hypothetical protein VMT15_13445 [Bryobacteraceae bacterium]|nr:hypothetical protein [Bryobacteraceae bacterium]
MKTLMSTLLVIAAASTMAVAGDKPDFSGTWKLDADKSVFGPMPPPNTLVSKIKHNDPDLVVETTQDGAQGEQTSTAKYSTDGKETTNMVQGNEVKSKATWDGKVLVVNSNLDAGGAQVKFVAKFSLSDDGKTLTQALMISAPQGDFDMTFVLSKQ